MMAPTTGLRTMPCPQKPAQWYRFATPGISPHIGLPLGVKVMMPWVTLKEMSSRKNGKRWLRVPPGLRVLVNNAGLDAPYLPVEHAPLTMWRELFDTNLFGLIEVTRRAIPALREAGGGVICNVSSCSILVPMPFFAAYRASKAAVSALGESLRTEVRPFGIRVLEVQPGAIGTDMLAESERLPEAAEHADYRAMAERVHASRRAASGQVTSAEDAARAIGGAILDDASPLRVACDPMGAGLLETWRASSDEEMMSGMLAHFAPRQA